MTFIMEPRCEGKGLKESRFYYKKSNTEPLDRLNELRFSDLTKEQNINTR